MPFSPLRRRLVLGIASAPAVAAAAPAWAPADPLPSWNDTAAKRAILEFVAQATAEGGPRYVPPGDRIATFDNDGTLWCEQPTIEVVYTRERAAALLAARPELTKQRPYDVLLRKDPAVLSTLGAEDVVRILADTHTGMTEDEFLAEVTRFFATARHPRFGVAYTRVVYQPQLELLAYLRAHAFKIFICSGGEISFMRAVSQDLYGVPPEHVIGTYFLDTTEERNGRLVLRRTSTLVAINDKGAKPVGIKRHIGKRPILACGNVRSGGDVAMLRYAKGHTLPSLALLVDHDDGVREAAYAETDGASLAAARGHGFTVVSMRDDWRRVFAFQ
jgi:hypothetical protein